MAWQNLGEELEALFSDSRPDTMATSFRNDGPACRRPAWDSAPLATYNLRQKPKDTNELRWNRRMLAQKRAGYTESDRNRTYTIRKAIRAYQRGSVCANDVTGRFVKRTA